MAQISRLIIEKQSGNDNTYFAKWEFNEESKNNTTTTGAIKEGNLVSIKSGATYYNGVAIPDWVQRDKWYVIEVSDDRAVLGKNESGTNDICSPINVANLVGGSGSSPSTISEGTLDYYEVKWHYDTGDGVWFAAGTTKAEAKNATYNGSKGAIRIKATVKPVSKTRKVNKEDTPYWTAKAVSATYSISADPPAVPKTPTVKIEQYKLTASLENIGDARTDEITFEIYSGSKRVQSASVKVLTARAGFSCTVAAGGEYRARCRAVNLYEKTRIYSGWSDYSAIITTMPNAPAGITVCRASSSTSIFIEWAAATGATDYDLEYTTNINYFDGSDQTKIVAGIKSTHYEKTGLETGNAYFFRVRATNSKGESAWSGIKSITIGNNPAAPTTWSSTTTAITGEPLTLYWVHNAEDESNMTFAEVELTIGGRKETYTITGSGAGTSKTYTYPVDTSKYAEGTAIQWRVRTAGITKVYGDWSMQRTVDIYAPPTLELTMTDLNGAQIETLGSFPFHLSGLAGPRTQAPTGYHVSITANEVYKTTDRVGNEVLVNKGDAVYSRYFDISKALAISLSASDLDFENNVAYTVTCTVSMNSGLTATAERVFTVAWTAVGYEPDAEISINRDVLTAYIKPYCIDEGGFLIDDIFLSVYRREFDGSFTELAHEIDNASNTVITDPHP
ncbi:MAG: fibronectin type III domain-containing protein, partial [Odoribacter sp.]